MYFSYLYFRISGHYDCHNNVSQNAGTARRTEKYQTDSNQRRVDIEVFTSFDEEHRDRTGKNESSAAKAEICSLTACVPLDVGLTEQVDSH